jgi:hypothetical protein
MEYTKTNNKEIEIVYRQKIFKDDLLSEKETIEARLKDINELLDTLDKDEIH